MENMTVISEEMYNKAINGGLTINEAAQMLKTNLPIRTLREKIEKFDKSGDAQRKITEGMVKNHPEEKKDSIEKKVRGWFNNAERNIKRKSDAIEICFILKLNIEETDYFLALVFEEGLHWRDPEDIIYIYAIKNGFTYSETLELMEKINVGSHEEKTLSDLYDEDMTSFVREQVLSISSEQELIDYLRSAKANLGRYHNTAYVLFEELYSILENATGSSFKERSMSDEEIIKEYFYKNVVPRFKKNESNADEKKASLLSVIQKSVHHNWPDEFTVSRIRKRRVDVSRKALILIFLATDGGDGEYVNTDIDIDDETGDNICMTRQETFEEIHTRVNTMLANCGFSILDPRVPFDWMILYCMCVDEVFEIDKNMSDFISHFFESGN